MQGNTNEKLLAVLVTPLQSVETVFQQLLTQRTIDTAVGAQLDVIGRIVGQARNGLDDETFRRYCRAKISANRSNGTLEDIYRVITLVVYDDNAFYDAHREGTATVRVFIDELPITEELANISYSFLRKTVSAGVRLVVQSIRSARSGIFKLNSGPGFNQGHLAAQIG